ncbi:GAF domain-containing protein [Nocardioides currus]|uniref:Diguanylate cyclase n=1 Tax=Nocardioides currus TaxID=2133958 RepID=A0A2R7YUW1_9ACTN|nr:GAF domain-containing protein [Nocardioides currus]PUA79679.1 diguanylate cyclase [Nocardioides currus]
MGEESAPWRSRDRVLSGGAPSPGIRPEISASWRRVRAGGLAPGAEPEVAPLTEGEVESRRSTSALAPLLPSITSSLAPVVDDGLLVVVTDTEGRVLWRQGSSGVRRLADRLGFVPGSAWTESNVGTNAIGTSLVVGEPVHIQGPEHYVDSHTRWSCAAAPVLDPWTGETLGAVDISGPAFAVQRSVLALVGVTARLAGAEVRSEHAAALERLRAHAAPVLARVGGRSLAVDPTGHIAAVTGFTAPDRLVLPADLSPESTWLPTLGAVTVEPLPGGWLVRLGSTTNGPAASRLELDLREGRTLRVSTASHDWEHRPSRRHAEILLALAQSPAGRTAAELADDLFADASRALTVRAEMSRLRRTLGSLLEAQPYRIAPSVHVTVLFPHDGPAIPGSSAPVVAARRPEPPLTSQPWTTSPT